MDSRQRRHELRDDDSDGERESDTSVLIGTTNTNNNATDKEAPSACKRLCITFSVMFTLLAGLVGSAVFLGSVE